MTRLKLHCGLWMNVVVPGNGWISMLDMAELKSSIETVSPSVKSPLRSHDLLHVERVVISGSHNIGQMACEECGQETKY